MSKLVIYRDMDEDGIDTAIQRIEAALERIGKAAETIGTPATASQEVELAQLAEENTALKSQHDRLQAEVAASLKELDSVLKAIEG